MKGIGIYWEVSLLSLVEMVVLHIKVTRIIFKKCRTLSQQNGFRAGVPAPCTSWSGDSCQSDVVFVYYLYYFVLTKIFRYFIFFSLPCRALYVAELQTSQASTLTLGRLDPLLEINRSGDHRSSRSPRKSTHWHVFITSANTSSISPQTVHVLCSCVCVVALAWGLDCK